MTNDHGYFWVASGNFGGTVKVADDWSCRCWRMPALLCRGTVVNEAIHTILRHDPAFTSASAGQQGTAFYIFKVAASTLEQFYSGSATSDNLVSIIVSGADSYAKGTLEFGSWLTPVTILKFFSFVV